MIKLRYEEYPHLVGEIPFVLNKNLTRTPLRYSEKQNWHENLEIQFCLEGQGKVIIDGKQHEFNKNDIVVVNSNSIHYTCSDTSITYSCIIVGTDFCKQMGIDYNGIYFQTVLQDSEIFSLFSRLCDAYNDNSSLRVAKVNHLLLEILILLVDKYSTIEKPSRSGRKELKKVKDVLSYIRENFYKKITLGDIAKSVFTDKYTLCKTFKNITGQTIFENINAYRCMKASEYIKEGKSVAEAGYLCGFENSSFFTKTFKKYKGVLPSKFKEK